MPVYPYKGETAGPPNAAGAYTAGADEAPRTPFWADGATGGAEQLGPAPPWYRVQLGGVWLPGMCVVRSPGRVRKVLPAAAAGDSAEEITDTGAENAGAQIVCYMWTLEHLKRWEVFLEQLEEQGGSRGDPKALDVVHPGLNLAGISSLYVLGVSIPEPSNRPGMFEATLLATEFRPKKPGKPKTIASSVSATPANLTLAPEIATAASPAATEAGP
jgi:hypothetical protein